MTGIEILSPLAGWAGPLDEVDDEVFAARMLGDGIAIDPTDEILCAPCDGEITALPESAHAVTIRSDHGAELLLHVGIDTVALKGAGFQAIVAAGQRVTAGQALIRFDPDRLARSARSLVTPVIVTEPERFQIAWRREPGTVRTGELIMKLRRRRRSDAGGRSGRRQDRRNAPHGARTRLARPSGRDPCAKSQAASR